MEQHELTAAIAISPNSSKQHVLQIATTAAWFAHVLGDRHTRQSIGILDLNNIIFRIRAAQMLTMQKVHLDRGVKFSLAHATMDSRSTVVRHDSTLANGQLTVRNPKTKRPSAAARKEFRELV